MSDTNNETVDQDSNQDADLRSEIEKLKAKNKELLLEKQKAKQDAQAARDAADDAATDAAAKRGDIDALKAAHKRELEKLQNKLGETEKKVRTITVDNAIKDALAQGNVKPQFHKAVAAMIKAELDDGVDGTIGGQPITEFAKDFFKSPEGSEFVRAADNSGGGAQGSDGSKAAEWTKPPTTPDEHFRLAKLSVDDPKAFNSAMDRFGTPERKI